MCQQTQLISRAVICASGLLAIGSLFLHPASFGESVVDVIARSYLMFVGTVMAHEASHGHLGHSKAANYWWGRLALITSVTPYINFRKTHHLHHIHTNIPEKDPDHFVKPRTLLEIPLRAALMPHQWFFWLRKRGYISKSDVRELVWNYVLIGAVYSALLAFVGPARLLGGMAPALIAESTLLWYVFALKTHEGFSTGSPESRSHNYYGRLMYWFSFGLSMHRAHHLQPQLTWLDLRSHVRQGPGGRRWWLPRRDVRLDVSAWRRDGLLSKPNVLGADKGCHDHATQRTPAAGVFP